MPQWVTSFTTGSAPVTGMRGRYSTLVDESGDLYKNLDLFTRVNKQAIFNLSTSVKDFMIKSHDRFHEVTRDMWLNLTVIRVQLTWQFGSWSLLCSNWRKQVVSPE